MAVVNNPGDGAERIRRHELSRALKRMDLSPEQGAAVEEISRSLVVRLLRGPIRKSRVYAAAERASHEVAP